MEAQNGYQCSRCSVSLKTLGGYSHHQKIHANESNFQFECGFLDCPLKFSTFGSLTAHISKLHKPHRKVCPGTNAPVLNCSQCPQSLGTLQELVKHLQDEHLAKGTPINCPFSDCGRTTQLGSKSIFSKHLSQHHKDWREMPITSLVPVVHMDRPSTSGMDFGYGGDDDEEDGENNEENADGQDEDECYGISEEDLFTNIGKFYLMLEGDCLLPVTAIDKISQNLASVTEIVQCHMQKTMISDLKAQGLSQTKIDSLVCKLADSNPLYLLHQKNMRGPTFTTEYRRRKFFDDCFETLKWKYYDLSMDPLESAPLAYKSLRVILTKLLSDPTVQKEIVKSFERFQSPPSATSDGDRIYKDYTDGSVMQGRRLPAKRLDLIMMQDAFSATSMLTTVAGKHKVLSVYATLGNLRPRLRTKLKAIQLVMLMLDKHVKMYRQQCFARLQLELADLETNGIMFMGEVIPVLLQFFVGDNLGSHFLAGFVEGFTARYPCRFCLIQRKQFKEDLTRVGQARTQAGYTRSAQIVAARNLNNHQGVKENAILNNLQNFKVCDPSFPPCLGHDLFHGVVNYDLTKVIKMLVAKKWFSYETLNKRINSFEYGPTDSKNKPAPVRDDGKKLGGSAVQNWTLLRLLPLILEGLIVDTDDPAWKLYLKLKRICEISCAPEISDKQVDELDDLVETYLIERAILKLDPKTKHHYFRHLAWFVRLFGAPIHLWAMRFEHAHQLLKRIARNCNNYINLIKTIATRYEIRFTYESTGNRFPDSVKCQSKALITVEALPADVSAFVKAQNFSTRAQVSTGIEIDGLDHAKGKWLAVRQTNVSCEVGLIECIVLDDKKIFSVSRKHLARLKAEHGLYEIDDEAPGELVIQQWDEITNPRIQEVYDFDEGLHFSLKHSLLP